MEENAKPTVKMQLINGYRFQVSFPGTHSDGFVMDEPEPLGNLVGPNASRVLAASVGNCLSASLLFCLQKGKVEVDTITTDATPTVQRNEEGYWRVVRIEVNINAKLTGHPEETRINRCKEVFEKYCVVTASVRKSLPVDVNVVFS